MGLVLCTGTGVGTGVSSGTGVSVAVGGRGGIVVGPAERAGVKEGFTQLYPSFSATTKIATTSATTLRFTQCNLDSFMSFSGICFSFGHLPLI